MGPLLGLMPTQPSSHGLGWGKTWGWGRTWGQDLAREWTQRPCPTLAAKYQCPTPTESWLSFRPLKQGTPSVTGLRSRPVTSLQRSQPRASRSSEGRASPTLCLQEPRVGAGLGPGHVARAEALRPPAGLPVMGLYQASGSGGLWGGVCTLAGPAEQVRNRYCTCLFFINDLLEVPGELQSFRGRGGLPQAHPGQRVAPPGSAWGSSRLPAPPPPRGTM